MINFQEKKIILIRGGGDLASGIVFRLHKAGLRILITELPQPLVVRRLVAFAEAVYRGSHSVEGVTARLVKDYKEILPIIKQGMIPIIVDPDLSHLLKIKPFVIVDARMTKRLTDYGKEIAQFVVGVGPVFFPGQNCHAAVESKRGHTLGRVFWNKAPQANTAVPGTVIVAGVEYREERVLRAPSTGALEGIVEIGSSVEKGDVIAKINSIKINAPFKGVVRGLIHSGVNVKEGMKIGDLDPRNDVNLCTMISDKSLAIGGGVLEAILSNQEIRQQLWVQHAVV